MEELIIKTEAPSVLGAAARGKLSPDGPSGVLTNPTVWGGGNQDIEKSAAMCWGLSPYTMSLSLKFNCTCKHSYASAAQTFRSAGEPANGS